MWDKTRHKLWFVAYEFNCAFWVRCRLRSLIDVDKAGSIKVFWHDFDNRTLKMFE